MEAGTHARRLEQLKKAGIHTEALNTHLTDQVGKLSDQEIKTLVDIRRKLNKGLPAGLADPVGVVVW